MRRKQEPDVLDAFRKVNGIKKSIRLRGEKGYAWERDEFGRFHRDGLNLMLSEEATKLRDYWKTRIRSYGRLRNLKTQNHSLSGDTGGLLMKAIAQ
jgi:hypothetical protein